jgi:FtsZ-interacting cell division protein ZipA
MNINFILLVISIALIIILCVLLSIKEKNRKKIISDLKKERDSSTQSAMAHTIAMQKAEQRVIDIKEKYSRIISEEEELIRIKTEANVINDEILSIQNTYHRRPIALSKNGLVLS